MSDDHSNSDHDSTAHHDSDHHSNNGSLRVSDYSPGSAAAQGLQCCHHCGLLAPSSQHRCKRCHTHLQLRKKYSLQRTWALLITAILLYIPANLQPIMRTNLLGQEDLSTILGGVVLLWEMGSWPIATVIFIASVMVPLGKMLALIWLCLSVSGSHKRWPRQRTMTYRITELVGRWSMVDVFVVAILVALIQLGQLMSIYPGNAALAFAGVVIFTMLAANSFDPRLIWDKLPPDDDSSHPSHTRKAGDSSI